LIAAASKITGLAPGSIMATIMIHHMKNISATWPAVQSGRPIISMSMKLWRVISTPLMPMPAPENI
jgi:hypothetical protein